MDHSKHGPQERVPGSQSSGTKVKLLRRVRLAIRARQYSPRTEEAYVG